MPSIDTITTEIQENSAGLLKAEADVAGLLVAHGKTVRSKSTRKAIGESAGKLTRAKQTAQALRQAGKQLDKERTKAVRDAQEAHTARCKAYVDDRMGVAVQGLRDAAVRVLALAKLGDVPMDLCGQLSGLDCSAELSKMENEIGSN